MDIVTYKIAQKYADKVAAGFSSVRVDDLDIIFTLNDGKTATVTVPAPKDGVDGQDGNGIISIEKTGTEGLVDTYTIYFTNGTTTIFTVTNGSGGSGGITNYEELTNKPKINNTTLTGNKSLADLGIEPANANIVKDENYVHTDYNFTGTLKTKLEGIETGAQVNTVTSVNGKIGAVVLTNTDLNAISTSEKGIANGVATLDVNGLVPSTQLPDYASKESTSNKVTILSSSNTDIQYPSAKTVYDNFVARDEEIGNKVDKEQGKSLISDTEIQRLANVTNYNDTEVKQSITNLNNNKANKNEIPDVSSFITKTVNDLTNYYLKNETYSKAEVNSLIGQISTVSIEVVQTLPANAQTNVIYFVPKTGTTDDVYNEYIYVNDSWELIGNTEVDLTGYATKNWVNVQIANFLTQAQIETLISNSLTGYARTQDIPTNLSELNDDSTHRLVTDAEKNTWNGKANMSDIPDVSSFITNTVNNLTNYYSKSEIDTALDNYISEIASLVGGNA